MDLSAASLGHPNHFFPHSSVSKLKYEVGDRFPKKEQVRKYVCGLINTQPVAPPKSPQYYPHFEVVKGDQKLEMPAGEQNIFYSIMVCFVNMLKEHKSPNNNALEVKYGDYDW